MSTQIERSTATRSRILAVARAAFVKHGYDGVSLTDIAAEAGFTKGALYHHYNGKEALFAAVFSLVSQETIDDAGRQASRAGTPREQLKRAALAWLDAVERGDARAIIIDLAPKALGFARARDLEDRIILEPLLGRVRAIIRTEGLGDAVDALLVARLVMAAVTEIALLRQASGGQTPTADQAARAVDGVIDGVLRPG